MNIGLFYKDRPVFGLDLGSSSIKVMQIVNQPKYPVIVGYGTNSYDSSATKDGVIEKPKLLAKATKELFEKNLIGDIDTKRVNLSVPVARTYSRVMTLPNMDKKDLDEAVRTEAEQYIPVAIQELYIDYNITAVKKDSFELLVVAVPKKIIDSYLVYTDLLGLETAVIEPTINASSRLVASSPRNNIPTLLIDFGSMSVDITIYDQQMIVTGTVMGGGENFTDLIRKRLDVSKQVAQTIKTKYGLGVSKKQHEIEEALKPILNSLSKEIKKMLRYYNDRMDGKKEIEQIITMGGGANMPGLSEFLTSNLRMSTRMYDPWLNLKFNKLQPPNDVEKSMYVTAAGLALINHKEI